MGRPSAKEHSPFGLALGSAVQRRGMTFKQFADRAGLSVSFVSNLCTGIKKPPVNRLEEWADLLRLRGAARRDFIWKGHMTRATPLLRRWFERLERVTKH